MDALSLATNGIIAPMNGEIIVISPQLPFNLSIVVPKTLKTIVQESDKVEATISIPETIEVEVPNPSTLSVSVMEPDKIETAIKD